MTDVADTSIADTPAPDQVLESKPEIKPETPAPPEPRITNKTEGGKKQKEAVKRLSDYSKGVASKREDKPSEDADPEPEVNTTPTQYPTESSMSVGKLIAAAGVAVAVVCLYLSYKPERAPTEENPEEPKTVVRDPSRIAEKAPKPKFRRL